MDAAQTATQRAPRPAAEVKKREEEEAPRAEEPETPKLASSPLFKPYSLSFRFVEELNRVVVKVIDPETGEAVREIPPESVIEALKLLKQQSGRLVDEEA
jgi:uncharacterized FlaG/YvyC family protein